MTTKRLYVLTGASRGLGAAIAAQLLARDVVGIAETYAAARPEYPDALLELIARHVPVDARVWEPGCGSGQATRGLAARFAHVHATRDPSAEQAARHWAWVDAGGETVASNARNVTVRVEPGERTCLADASVQLIAVAQALHWFDRPAFFAECARVLAPGGVLAAWGYPDFLAPERMIEAVAGFRVHIDPYWPPERGLVDPHCAGFDWPFPALPTPELWLEATWTLPRFLAYLSSSPRSRAAGPRPARTRSRATRPPWPPRGAIRTKTARSSGPCSCICDKSRRAGSSPPLVIRGGHAGTHQRKMTCGKIEPAAGDLGGLEPALRRFRRRTPRTRGARRAQGRAPR